ncbi:Transcriptional regulator, AbiEi antitoxin, Type IV TA system [Microbacterium pygmaeum]|uniref:Transcriptional regulator, AbiEi antitoxin, Type IV TA system n=2 Tax=Microbacterium pygmaeum TaxID=370764 RepID=A0A1G7TF84_9MICO|nr:Transcriptional regulator, AbiEi antitoxin, Type IV TA system [Microbacterium pygmaeum]
MRMTADLTDLISRGELDARGLSSRAIAASVRAGRLHKLHSGWYIDGETWRAAHVEQRHRYRVLAAYARSRDGVGVASLVSAAVMWDLPLFRITPRRVHQSGSTLDGHVSTGDVARHEVDVSEGERVLIDGIPTTSLARTVADMSRLATPEAGLSIADAALRRVAWDPATRTYDHVAAEELREAVRASMERVRGARGVRRGRRIVALADGRAQLPGESVSRLYLLELGFAPPRLQVPIPDPVGGWYFVDFGLDDVNSWGEFDGVGKYLDARMRGGVDLERTLLAEKAREDWIRGTTNRKFPRWGMPALDSARTLGIRLAHFHVVPPR